MLTWDALASPQVAAQPSSSEGFSPGLVRFWGSPEGSKQESSWLGEAPLRGRALAQGSSRDWICLRGPKRGALVTEMFHPGHTCIDSVRTGMLCCVGKKISPQGAPKDTRSSLGSSRAWEATGFVISSRSRSVRPKHLWENCGHSGGVFPQMVSVLQSLSRVGENLNTNQRQAPILEFSYRSEWILPIITGYWQLSGRLQEIRNRDHILSVDNNSIRWEVVRPYSAGGMSKCWLTKEQ